MVIDAIEISYIATKDGKKVCDDGTPVGRHTIDLKHMPQELRAEIVAYITNVERARREAFEQLHEAYYLRLGIYDVTLDGELE